MPLHLKHRHGPSSPLSTDFLPDYIIYDIDEDEYRKFWADLRSHNRDYLYTDGIQVYKISWFRHALETIRGWFGYINHCQTNLVSITLAKIAYFGYLRGFNVNEPELIDSELISKQFMRLIGSERNNKNTNELQQLLIKYYKNHPQNFRADMSSDHSFGQAFADDQLYMLIPSLDPQNVDLIQQIIPQIIINGRQVEHFPKSVFAIQLAIYFTKMGSYKEALEWYEPVQLQFQEQFINYYLQQGKNNTVAVHNALTLIQNLLLSNAPQNRIQAVNYVINNYSQIEQTKILAAYPHLAQAVAQYYYHSAKTENNKSSLGKWLNGDATLTLVAHALILDPKILERDPTGHDIIQKWVALKFEEAVEKKRYADAWSIFETNKKTYDFDEERLNQLSDYLFIELKNTNQLSTEALNKKDTEQAKKSALEVIELAKKIHEIATKIANSSKINDAIELVITTHIKYAQTILQIDMLIQPEVKNSDLEALNEVEKSLLSYHKYNTSPELLGVVNQIIQRKINALIEKVKIPVEVPFIHEIEARREFLVTIQNELTLLNKNLDAFIALNKHDRTKEMRQTLGKMYYLKGDIAAYFFREQDQALPHFKLASETMPENPYYALRHHELAQNTQGIREAREKIEEMAIGQFSNYMLHMELRWDVEPSPINVEIHNVAAQEKKNRFYFF